MTRVTEQQIKESYQGKDLASGYFQRRFESELGRLLHRRQVRAVRSAIDATAPRRVLEVAPGPARLTRDIHVPGEHVCLEYNQGMVEVGSGVTGQRVRWVRGDAFALPFGEPFDLAYSFRFIRHFKEHDRARLYVQFHRALRPGGLLVFDAVNAAVSAPMRQRNPQAYPIYDVLYENLDQLRAELRAAGFEMIGAVKVQKNYRLQYQVQHLVAPRSALLARLLIGALERLSPGPPLGPGPLEWIVTCRRA